MNTSLSRQHLSSHLQESQQVWQASIVLLHPIKVKVKVALIGAVALLVAAIISSCGNPGETRQNPTPTSIPSPTATATPIPTPSPTPTPTPISPSPTPTPILPTATPIPPTATPLPTQFAVYTDAGAPGNHYIPSGFMGDYGAISLVQTWTSNPHSGTSCIRVVYTGATPQGKGWAGVYWQDPQNNWGTLPGGYNLSRFPHLSFWVRGEKGGEKIEFKMGGLTGPYGDSVRPAVSTGVITLTTSWQQVRLNLIGYNLTHIIGGFVWVTNTTENPHGATFYLDDILYTAT